MFKNFLAYYTLYKSDSIKTVVDQQLASKHAYAVIIDAGSTGSRVLALAFKKNPGQNKSWNILLWANFNNFTDGSLELEDELFVQVKPGLSSFAHDPKKVKIISKKI